MRRDCGIYNLCVYEKFFKKNRVNSVYREFNPSIYKQYMKDLNLKDKKVLVLISDLVGEGRIKEDTFI